MYNKALTAFSPERISDNSMMRELTGAYNWGQSSIGETDTWPFTLHTVLELVLSSKNPMFLWWGPELIQFYNDAYRECLGHDGKHPLALGQTAAECWPEIWDVIHPLIQSVLKGDSIWRENQLIPIYRNGRLENVYWTFSYTPVLNDIGSINGVLVLCKETTKQVLSEKHYTKQLSNLFLQAPVAICILLGPEYLIDVVNERMVEMWDRQTEDVLHKPAFDVLTELRDQGFKELLDSVFYTGIRYVTEELPINLKRHGRIENAFVKFVYEPLRDEDGTIYGVMALAHEITEQVLARKQVEDAERKTRIAIESANLGVYEINLESNEMIGDSRFFEVFGFTEKVSREQLISTIHPDDLHVRETAHEQSLISGKLYYEARVIHKNKSIHWLRAHGTTFYNEDNLPIKLLGVVDDVTIQKQMEKQKDNFLAMASHELKTPVTTIKAYGQLAESMLESKDDILTLNIVKRLGTQADKLTILIDNLLDITKIQQGNLQYNKVIFDFNDLVKEVTEDAQMTCIIHNIEFHSGQPATVFGDKEKMVQVINNLLSNARKYSQNASRIIVTSEVQGEGVQLSVHEFGIGIPEEEQKHIFKQFYRVNGATQSTYPGMGIGLYICSEFIKGHDGRIWVESTIDQGSIFYILIPFAHFEF